LYLPTVTVSGNVGDTSFSVWVNGVPADMDGSGGWTANNVPVTPGGTASFIATAYPADEVPSTDAAGQGSNPRTANSCDNTCDEDKPPRVYIQNYELGYSSQVGTYTCLRLQPVTEHITMSWTKDCAGANSAYNWVLGLGYPTNVAPGNEAVT